MKFPRIFISALASIVAGALPAAHGDEFTDLSNSFGTVTRLAGLHQGTTNDVNGNPINFWIPQYEGAPANTIALSNPHMAAADDFGNVYIADKSSHSILKITTDGLIHTYAGTHVAGFNGDGPALASTLQINNPNGLFVFGDGTLYILDPGNHRIRRIAPDGTMTTIVNDPDPNWYPSGRALWVSPDKQLIYYSNEFAPIPPSIVNDGSVIKKWTPANGIEIVCDKALGIYNPGNIAVNPVDGKLYVCDRAETDTSNTAGGLFRIDGVNQRTRITGNVNQPVAASGQFAIESFIQQPRGIAFLPNGAYFICGHKDGPIWYVDTGGVLHEYIRGKGSKDTYTLPDGAHPPAIATTYFCQPRAVTITPNGTLLCVCNDSGFVFKVNGVLPPVLPTDVKPVQADANGLRLDWTGIFGHGYIVERTLGLQPAAWEVVGAVNGTGGLTEYLDSSAGVLPQAFYRLTPPSAGTASMSLQKTAAVQPTATAKAATTVKATAHFSGSRRRTASPM